MPLKRRLPTSRRVSSGHRPAMPWAGAPRRRVLPKRIVLPKKILPPKQAVPAHQRAAATSWGPVADWYRDLLYGQDETFQQTVIQPNLRRILGLRPGAKLLDLACGPGFFSRSFARLGVDVTGVDIAPELVAAAEEALRREGTDVAERARFHVAEADRISFLPESSVDAAIIVLALQNIQRAKETVAAAARVLKPGGRLVVVLNHPCFRVPKGSSWGWDGTNMFRRVDRYLSEWTARLQAHPGSDPLAVTVSFHRPLQYYFMCLAKAGLLVAGLEEWISDRQSGPGTRAAEENRTRKEFPLFLCLTAVKPA